VPFTPLPRSRPLSPTEQGECDAESEHSFRGHIVNQKSGNFEPDKFEDHYETALIELINSKRSGKAVAGFAGLIAVVVWKRLI
jgi:non-homologous end joining protein Ku